MVTARGRTRGRGRGRGRGAVAHTSLSNGQSRDVSIVTSYVCFVVVLFYLVIP